MINTIGKSPIQQPTRSFKGYPLPPLSEKKSYSESLRIFFKHFLKNICLSAYLFQNDRYTGPEHPLSMSTKSCHFKKDATSCHLKEDIILIRFCAKSKRSTLCLSLNSLLLSLTSSITLFNLNKAGYTANTSRGRVGRGEDARFHTFKLDQHGPTDRRTNGRTDKASYRVACPQLKRVTFLFIGKTDTKNDYNLF